jgi:phage-related protein
MRVLIGKYYIKNNQRLLNGLLLGTSDSKIQMTEITGLECPPIRLNNGDWSGKDGGFMSAELFSGREISISGFYYDNEYPCIPGQKSIRETMVNFLKIRTIFPIFFETNNGDIYYTEGFLTAISCPYTNFNYGEYQLTFYCPSAELKVAEQFGDIDSITKRELIYRDVNTGGHLVPEDLPVMFETGYSSSVIQYDGSMFCYPKIILNGPFSSDIVVMNYTTNKTLTIKKEIATGSIVTIDMNARQVLENGSSISLYIDENSEWWYLQPGANKIYLNSGNSDTDNISGTIEWTINEQGC